jgi:cytoskeletal protein RodZ
MRNIGIVIVILAVVLALSSCSFKANLGNVPEDKPAGDAAKSASADKPATGTEPASEAASKYKVKVLEAGDARDESSRDITHTTTTFTTAVKEIYVNAGITGLTKGDTITGTMMAVDVVTGTGAKVRDAKVASADVSAPGAESTANFNFSPPDKGWPTGSYTVDVSVNGEKVDAIELTITKAGQ